MSRRKNWTPQEDEVLRLLKEKRGLKKWSEIAKKMGEQFGIGQRTGKQCRERYHNHLDSAIVANEWSQHEEQTLNQLHTQIGNKWSVIAQQLPGRSDNCVKNHFYSKLRKSTRKLNRIIHESSCPEWHQIKLSLLNKIVETTEERFKNSSKFQEEIINCCAAIVNGLFSFEKILLEGATGQQKSMKALISETMWIESKLRKSSKCLREQREQNDTTQEAKEHDKSSREGAKSEHKEEPFYEIFRRVCENIILNNN